MERKLKFLYKTLELCTELRNTVGNFPEGKCISQWMKAVWTTER